MSERSLHPVADLRGGDETDACIEIMIEAPPGLVFEFLTEPEKVLRWFGNGGAVDTRPGGRLDLTFGDDGDRGIGEFVEIDPPRRVSFTWGWEGSDDVPPGSTTVTIDLTADGDRTVVRLTHVGLPSAAHARGQTIGWTYYGRRLAAVVTGSDPDEIPFAPDDDRHVGESVDEQAGDFAAALTELRAAERELMLQRERVAEQRRALPTAPPGRDYEFEQLVDGSAETVRLSELFTAPDRTLIVYHFMYGKQQTSPCPMCSAWTDGWNSIERHLTRRVDFVVAAAAPIAEWIEVVGQRGWTNLRHVSAAPSSFKLDVGGEDADGNQTPFISVWTLDDEGRPRQRYGGAAQYDAEHWRGLDLLSPIWHLLDLTPEGRGDYFPSL